MVEIIPAILTNNPIEAFQILEKVKNLVQRVQVDIIDDQFFQNKTIEPDIISEADTNLLLDFHLMVKEPVNWVEKCVRGGADRIIGQIEMMSNQMEFISKVQEVGRKVGIALDIETSFKKIDPTILTDLDVVLVMNYPAGKGGQKFQPRVLEKVKELNEIKKKDQTPFRICSDGGINKKNIGNLAKAGVDEAVVGRSLFSGDISKNISI